MEPIDLFFLFLALLIGLLIFTVPTGLIDPKRVLNLSSSGKSKSSSKAKNKKTVVPAKNKSTRSSNTDLKPPQASPPKKKEIVEVSNIQFKTLNLETLFQILLEIIKHPKSLDEHVDQFKNFWTANMANAECRKILASVEMETKTSLLMETVKHGKLEILKFIVELDEPYLQLYESSSSPLQVAFKKNRPDMFCLLLSMRNVNVNETFTIQAKSKDEKEIASTLAREALKRERFDFLKAIVEHSTFNPYSNVDQRTGFNILHEAIKLRVPREVLEFLIASGKFTSSDQTFLQMTSFLLACSHDNIEAARVLFSGPHLDINYRIKNASLNSLEISITNGSSELVELILSHPDLDESQFISDYIFSVVPRARYFNEEEHISSSLNVLGKPVPPENRSKVHSLIMNRHASILEKVSKQTLSPKDVAVVQDESNSKLEA